MQNSDKKNIPTICATVIEDFMISEDEQNIILQYRHSDKLIKAQFVVIKKEPMFYENISPIKQAIHRILDPPDSLNK
jgi:hypothetical protein